MIIFSWTFPEGDTVFSRRVTMMDSVLFDACALVGKYGVAVDIGAHIGTWTLPLAGAFKKVYAFEPHPDNYRCLKANTAGCNNVEARNVALGEKVGTCDVCDDPMRHGNSGARITVLNEGAPVLVIPLDSLHLPAVDLLKLDVEGAEILVLRGAEETLKRTNPVIVMEVKDLGRHGGPQVAVRFLLDIGFKEVGGQGIDRIFKR